MKVWKLVSGILSIIVSVQNVLSKDDICIPI